MDFGFVQDRYDFEMGRKERLTASLALPIGALGVLGSAGVAMARTFTYASLGLTGAFAGSMLLGAVAFTACLLCLRAAYLAQSYSYLPLLGEIQEFEDQLTAFLVEPPEADETARAETEHELRRRMIRATDANTMSNERRSRILHWSRVALLATVALGYMAGISYSLDQVRSVMPQDLPKPAQPAVTSQSVPPRRPTFPPNRIIKEGREPRPEVVEK